MIIWEIILISVTIAGGQNVHSGREVSGSMSRKNMTLQSNLLLDRTVLLPGLRITNDTERNPSSYKMLRRIRRLTIDHAVIEGYAVFIDPFTYGMVATAVASNIREHSYTKGSKLKSEIFTDSYRWVLRYFNRIPDWLRGSTNFGATHHQFHTRSESRDVFVPKAIKKLTSDIIDWEEEEKRWDDYQEFAADAFVKGRRLPKKIFDFWESQERH